jgi:hypothetical protein
MLLAAFAKEGREYLVVGLEDDNIRKLRNDEPIERRLEGIPGIADGTMLVVLGPEDTARFVARFGPEAPE